MFFDRRLWEESCESLHIDGVACPNKSLDVFHLTSFAVGNFEAPK